MPKKHEHEEPLFQCGHTNRKDDQENVLFLGGCGKLVPFSFVYRCGECTGFFHRHCLYEHFKHNSVDNEKSLAKVLQKSRLRAKKDRYPS